MNQSATASCGVLVELPQSLAARLLHAAQAEDLTLNRFLHIALTEYLDRLNEGGQPAAQTGQGIVVGCDDGALATLRQTSEGMDTHANEEEAAS